MGDDRHPEVTSGGEEDDPHDEADRSSEQHTERVLVGMYQPEQYRLDQTRDGPCYFGAAEEHGEPLKAGNRGTETLRQNPAPMMMPTS